MRLFAPEGSAEGCASGECLPEPAADPAPAPPRPASPNQASPARAAAPSRPASADQTSPTRAAAPSRPASPEQTSPARTGDPAGPAMRESPPGGVPPAAASAAPTTAAPAPVAAEPEDHDEEPPAPVAGRGVASEADQWRRAVDAVREASPRHGKSLSYARFLGFVPEGVRLAFPPDAAFHRAQVTGMSRAMIEAELTRVLRRPMRLVEDTNAQALQAAPKSIAEVEATDRASRERAIDEKVRTHPALRLVLKHLGGSLEHVSYLEPVAKPAAAPANPDEGDGGPPVD